MLIVQSNDFNQSEIRTVIVATITNNLRLADAPGNVKLSKRETGLRRKSVVNVSQLITLDKSFLTDRVRAISQRALQGTSKNYNFDISPERK